MFGKFVHVVKIVVRGFLRHDCGLHAAGLTYFSLLTVVPILCLLLLLARTLGAADCTRRMVNDRIDAFITEFEQGQDAAPGILAVASSEEEIARKKEMAAVFSAQIRDVANTLFDRVEKFNVKTIGWVGLAFLLWSVISTLGMVEVAFNRIWGVKRDRPVWKKAYLYALASVVLPLLVAVAFSLPVMGVVKNVISATAGVTTATKYLGDFFIAVLDSKVVAWLFSFAFTSFAFAFCFKYLPHVKVLWRAALEAGAVTAVFFVTWLKACAIAQVGIASSSALYGSFAALPILFAWLYMSWQIVLLGANLSYALQQMHLGGVGVADGSVR